MSFVLDTEMPFQAMICLMLNIGKRYNLNNVELFQFLCASEELFCLFVFDIYFLIYHYLTIHRQV